MRYKIGNVGKGVLRLPHQPLFTVLCVYACSNCAACTGSHVACQLSHLQEMPPSWCVGWGRGGMVVFPPLPVRWRRGAVPSWRTVNWRLSRLGLIWRRLTWKQGQRSIQGLGRVLSVCHSAKIGSNPLQ